MIAVPKEMCVGSCGPHVDVFRVVLKKGFTALGLSWNKFCQENPYEMCKELERRLKIFQCRIGIQAVEMPGNFGQRTRHELAKATSLDFEAECQRISGRTLFRYPTGVFHIFTVRH